MSTEYLRTGSLLLSEPFLQDPLFGRAVILVCHYDEDGAFGLILNKPASNPFQEEGVHPLCEFPFFAGGPVDANSMFFVHRIEGLPEAVPLCDGICWQGRYEDLLEAVKAKEFQPENCRLLIGYTGWEKGQLENEIDREDWMLYNGSIAEILTTNPDSMWKDTLAKMGPYYKMVSNFPIDPSLN